MLIQCLHQKNATPYSGSVFDISEETLMFQARKAAMELLKQIDTSLSVIDVKHSIFLTPAQYIEMQIRHVLPRLAQCNSTTTNVIAGWISSWTGIARTYLVGDYQSDLNDVEDWVETAKASFMQLAKLECQATSAEHDSSPQVAFDSLFNAITHICEAFEDENSMLLRSIVEVKINSLTTMLSIPQHLMCEGHTVKIYRESTRDLLNAIKLVLCAEFHSQSPYLSMGGYWLSNSVTSADNVFQAAIAILNTSNLDQHLSIVTLQSEDQFNAMYQ